MIRKFLTLVLACGLIGTSAAAVAAQVSNTHSAPLISTSRPNTGASVPSPNAYEPPALPAMPAMRSVGNDAIRSDGIRSDAVRGDAAWISASSQTLSDQSPGPDEFSQKESSPAALRPLKPPTSSEAPTSKRSSGTGQMLVSVVSSMLIVIGLLLGAAWCYRRAVPHTTGAMSKQVVQVLGRTPLAPRQQLLLIRFGNKLLLVSNLQGEVRTLSEISDPLEVDRIAGVCESAQAGSVSDSFRTVLHSLGRNG